VRGGADGSVQCLHGDSDINPREAARVCGRLQYSTVYTHTHCNPFPRPLSPRAFINRKDPPTNEPTPVRSTSPITEREREAPLFRRKKAYFGMEMYCRRGEWDAYVGQQQTVPFVNTRERWREMESHIERGLFSYTKGGKKADFAVLDSCAKDTHTRARTFIGAGGRDGRNIDKVCGDKSSLSRPARVSFPLRRRFHFLRGTMGEKRGGEEMSEKGPFIFLAGSFTRVHSLSLSLSLSLSPAPVCRQR